MTPTVYLMSILRDGLTPYFLGLTLLVLGLSLVACERRREEPPAPTATAVVSDSVKGASASSRTDEHSGKENPAASKPDDVPVVLMLGDSLTAGFGLPEALSFPTLVQERIWAEGLSYKVVNAGVSGDTTAGGRSRLDWLLKGRVDIMMLALGANDGMRGQDPAAMRDNLVAIIDTARSRGIRVLLAGMQMPSNYGVAYGERFAAVFPELARAYDLPFIPFLLEGVAMRSGLNQADGIHPNAEGARIVAETVWRGLEPLLRE